MEIWNNVIGYENWYSISNLGRLRRDFGNNGTRSGKIISTKTLTSNGYPCASLCKNGIIKTHNIHKLVCMAFFGKPKNGFQINHIDGNKENNILSNLEYCTQSENQLHRFRILKKGRGSSHGQSKLTEKQVLKIRKLYKDTNISQEALAIKYNISQTNISTIVRRIFWTHI